MNKRVDLYSILIKEGYKLPKNWILIMDARVDISKFMRSMNLDSNVRAKMALYSDKQWRKLVWRLDDNGHVKK